MKKPLVFITFILIFASELFAQGGDTLKKVCDYKTFPIGAVRNYGKGVLEKMFGMNFGWYGWAPEIDSFSIQTSPINYGDSVRDPFYHDTTVNYQTHDIAADYGYNGLLNVAAYGKDIRVFMPGTSGITSEYNYGWNTKSGFFISPSDPEWEIRGDTAASGYVLSDLTGNPYGLPSAASDPYYDGGSAHRGTFSYELVYFFDTTHGTFNGGKWEAAGNTDSLYSIEYWLKKDGDTVFSFYLADTITKKSYRNIPLANTQVPGRNVNAENLAHWVNPAFPTGVPTSVQYRIQKHILRIDTMHYHQNQDGSWSGPQVDVRLRNFHKIPIFVRCLRIRDWIAQRLLTGKADSAMNKAIGILESHSYNDSIKSWSVGNEPPYQTFHCFAYLNDLFVKDSAPPLNVLMPWSPEEFIRVARDQSENLPGKAPIILWHEWVPYVGMFWLVNYGDHYDWDYNNFPIRPLLPSTFSSSPADSAEWYKRAIFFESNYATFTNHWQNTIIGYPSEVTGGVGYMKELQNIAQACYELDPLHPIPYWGCYSAMASPIHGWPLWVMDSAKFVMNDSIRHALHLLGHSDSVSASASQSASWADSVYEARIVNPYFTRNNLTKDSTIVADSLYHLFWDWRASTEAEVRSQLWTGICYGLKGYSANAAAEDIGSNDGFLWDHDGVITKSYDRTEMRLDNFLFSGGKLTRPYGTGFFRHDTAYKIKSKLLPAFKGMYNAVKHAVVNELGPIAPTLAQLNWKGAVSWHKRDSTPTYLSRLPVINVQAKTLSGAADLDSATYVDFGIFKKTIDSEAIYVSMMNRRLYTDPLDTLTTDYRTISFQVDPSKFNQTQDSGALWRITDVATNIDAIINDTSTYSFTVKPGQGKLFRIAPALGLDLGKMSDNLYNNGRHIAAIDTGSYQYYGVKQFVATYARNGNIAVSYPIETPSNLEKRKAGTPGDSVIDNSGNCHNPSIAYNHRNNTIGLTYRRVFPHTGGATFDTTWICYRRASYTTPYHFSAMKVIDTLLTPYNFISPPAIAPRDTSSIDSLKYGEFWVAYNSSDSGECLRLIDTSGNSLRKIHFWGQSNLYAKFVSIATHLRYDTVRIAFEEDFNQNPQIYYTDGYLSNTAALHLTDNPAYNISAPLHACQNHCPQVAIQPYFGGGLEDIAEPEEVHVAWEALNTPVLSSVYAVNYERYAVERRRRTMRIWSGYAIFRAGIFTTGIDSASNRILVNIETCTTIPHTIFTNSWHDFERLTWNDLHLGQIAIARYGFYIGSSLLESPLTDWYRYHYLEPAEEPAMANLSFGDLVVQPFLYRHTTPDENGLFDARIIRYNFPSNPVQKDSITGIINAMAQPTTNACNLIVRAKLTNIQLTFLDTTRAIPLHGLTDSMTDPNGFLPIGWNDKKGVRTFVFTSSIGSMLKYRRDFRVGGYVAGDTTIVASYLTGSSDYIRARIYLRRAFNDSILAILDSARLNLSGFVQTGSLADSGWKSVPLLFSDSIYMTMEISRGDTTNTFELARIESHGDIFYDLASMLPNDTSYKKAAPVPLSPSQSYPVESRVTITINPNPFEQSTHIALDVPKNILLTVSLFDILGRPVLGLFNNAADREHYDFIITKDQIAQGEYFLRVQSGSEVVTRKVQLLR